MMNGLVYKILWIDDEHDSPTVSGIKMRARSFNIELIPFKSLMAGMDELENNYPKYDGILLDAKFYENEDDVAGTEDRRNSIVASKRIDALPKKFDIHILTGQAEVYGDESYGIYFDKVYKKGNRDDLKALFESLRESASKQQNNQLKHHFQDVFGACKGQYLGDVVEDKLLHIAAPLFNESQEQFNTEHLTAIRKVIERVIKRLAELNLIPKEIADNKGWMNGSSLFISNKNRDYDHNEQYFHPLIAHTFHRLLDVLQDGSHMEGDLKLGVDKYLKSSINLYTIKSSAYQLFELLVWVKSFIDDYPDKESNLELWSKKESIDTAELGNDLTGFIAQDSQGNFHCNSYILDYRFTSANYNIGDQIEITEVVDNPKESLRYMYPKKGNRYKRV